MWSKRIGAVIFAAAVFIIACAALTVMSQRSAGARGAFAGAQGCACTFVIDAGHGGADGGAVSITGAKESEINLAIAKRLDQLLVFCGHRPVMTRTEENISYPADIDTIRQMKVYDQKKRLELVNSIDAPVFVSIHQNKFTTGSPSGPQVMYAATEGSRELAAVLQQYMISELVPTGKRAETQISDGIFLMNNVKCPAVLIECGFLSNAGDDHLLQTDGYQKKIAAAIAAGLLSEIEYLNDTLQRGTNT